MPRSASTIRSFTQTEPGTSEKAWLRDIGRHPEWAPHSGPLIVVSPHPDDEILAAGGLIHCRASAGERVTVVSVTDGEAAFPCWKGLDRVRRSELKGALRKLCLTHVEVVRIGIPDGEARQHTNKLRNALLDLIEPSCTMIAPYEHDGHPDHDAVGRVCMGVARSRGIAIARYPIWTWHHAEPKALKDARWGRFALSAVARRAKARAVRCFASQLEPPHANPIVPPHVLSHFERGYEAFLL